MKDLIHIYTAPDKITAELVKGFLKDNHIKALIKANPGPQGAFLGEFGGEPPINPWLVYVLKDKRDEAKEILKNFKPTVSTPSFTGPKGKASASFLLGLAWLWFFAVPFIAIPIQVAGIIFGIIGIKSSIKIFAALGIMSCVIGLIISVSILFLIIF